MAFKIKDGVRIGTVDVFNNAGTLLVNAPTATNLVTPRTISLSGDVTGSVSFDGSGNADIAATIAANSIALGTDTTGNYAASVGVSGNGLTITGAAGEGTAFTVNSNATNANTASTLVFRDASGNFSAGTISAALSGNASTATALQTARTIAISGAVTGTATSFDGSANISINATALAAGNLSGTIPSAVLGTSSVYIGTTAVALNRATAALALTGVSIDGNAGTVTNGVYTTGSYADPAWITSLANSKVGLGNVENTALSTWAGSTNITTIGAATASSLIVSGNLTVNGTTTTVNSTTVTVDDPILTLGGDTAPAADDAKDRGVEFRWHNGAAAKLGFFGFDGSTGKFTFIPDATNTSEVFSGTTGELDAKVDWSNILNKPAVGTGSVTSVAMTVPTGLTVSGSPITTSGTFAVTLTAGYSIPTTASQTNWDTAFADRNTWDGGATGLVAATGRTSLGATTVGSNLFTLTNPSAVTFLRVNADNTVSTLGAATFRTAIGAQASGSYLTAEADTLATVTGRGATTGTAVSITNATATTSGSTGALIVTGGVAVNGNMYVKGTVLDANNAGTVISVRDTVQASVAATTLTSVDTWAVASYRAAKYLVQITQGTNYQFSEIMVIHNGTTTTMTEYAVLETNGALGTFTSDVSAGNARLLVTMGSATAATVNIQRVLMVV